MEFHAIMNRQPMYRILPFFLFVLLITGSCKSEAEETADRNQIIDSTLAVFQQNLYQNQLDSLFTKHDFNGSIAVIQHGKPIYSRYSGFSDFSGKKELDSTTVFAIGSVSKQFTAVMILQQMEAGKLKLDDAASKYLPELQHKQFEKITVRHLLHHTSGLGDFGPNLQSQPGEKFSYSNKGFRFLGQIIENASGKSYDTNVMELFQKAGMKNSYAPSTFKNTHFGSAYLGTSKNQQEVENMPMRLAKDEISVPAGGLLSTVKDLAIWNEALYSGKIISAQSLKIFKEKNSAREHYVLGTVGYGTGIMMNTNAPEAYFHSGYVKGSPSLNVYYPATKTSVIILSNIADESKGKEAFFQPHAETKTIADAVENSVASVRSIMTKPAVPQ